MLRLTEALDNGVIPALALLPKVMDSQAARVMLLAIGMQESGLAHRYQVLSGGGKGPARGLMQFEKGTRESRGGVWGLYLHRSSHEYLRLLCRNRDVSFDPAAIWQRLEDDDVLAFACGRLMLWTDSSPLPSIGEPKAAWECYERVWRPGKPRPDHWPQNYAMAMSAIKMAGYP